MSLLEQTISAILFCQKNSIFSPLFQFLSSSMPIVVTEDEFLKFGLMIVGYNEVRQERMNLPSRLEDFRSFYGVQPRTCSDIFIDIQAEDLPEASRVGKPSYRHLLMTLYWLVDYDKQKKLAATFKLNVKTVRKWLDKYTKAIQAQKVKKVSNIIRMQ
jgi:hypothetical protein